MADVRFPRAESTPEEDSANLLFCKMCAENCMNMKEFGPGGGARPWHPLWIRHWNSLKIIKDTPKCVSHGYKIYLCTEVTFNLSYLEVVHRD